MQRMITKLKPLEIKLKNAAVGALSHFLKRSLARINKPDLKRPLRVLFVRHERIGDTLISFPVVDVLKKEYPNWEVSWVTAPRSIDLIVDDPRFKNVFVYTKNVFKDLVMLYRARQEKFDIAIDLINGDSVSALALSHLAAPGAYKIGVGKCHHADYYHVNARHPFSYTNRHTLESTLDLVSCLGINPSKAERFCPPYVGKNKENAMMEILSALPVAVEGRPLVGVNISSGEPSRTWGLKNFRRVIEKLLERYEEPGFIVIAAPSYFATGKALVESFDRRVNTLPRAVDICTLAALISRLNLLITADTSLVHIARSYRIPVVGLHRGQKINIWFPYAQLSGMVSSPVEEHLFDITVEQVVEKTIEIGQRFKIPGMCHV